MASNDPNDLSNIKARGWVSLRDFLKIADITYPTALRWCKLGMINYTQVGGTKRIYEEEIARFLREGTLKPNPEKFEAEKAKREEYRQNGLRTRKAALRDP